jgi:hypothetical protein
MFFSFTGIFNFFLFRNIKYLHEVVGDGSKSLYLLIFSFMGYLFLFFINLVSQKKIYVKKLYMAIICFFVYFIINTILNTNKIRSYTIGTDGGLILFYSIGVLMGVTFHRCINSINKSKRLYITLFSISILYLIIHTILLLDTFIFLLSHLRMDKFIVEELLGRYQRPGKFIVISTILTSYILISVLLSGYEYNLRQKKIVDYLVFIIGIIDMIVTLILTQLIGSNNGTVGILGLFLLNIFIIRFTSTKSTKILLSNKLYTKRSILSKKMFKKTIQISLSIITFIIIVGIIIINHYNIDLSIIRFSSIFTSAHGGSVDSRIDILKSGVLIDHLSYSYFIPFFGNMNIHELTNTAYVHSFIISMFTHLGLIGVLIFAVIFFYCINNINRISSVNIYNNGIKIYTVLLFLGFLLIATVGNFFAWTVIWFILGLVFPIRLKKSF